MSDFSDRPLVAGTIVGLRAFGVDKLGRLIGPSYAQVFAPGENVAECRKEDERFSTRHSFMMGTYADPYFPSFQPSSRGRMGVAPKVEPTVKHTPGVVTCSCGFYAYFNGRNDFKEASRVSAIIEGYGVVTMGTEGFRAEKARIVALVEPGRKFSDHLRSMLHRNYPDVAFYATKTEALEAHPLSVGHLPTPDDEDFWTRGAR